MSVVLVAHGTRDPRGGETTARLAAAVADRLGEPVAVAFADVVEPSVESVLRSLPDGPVTVLPAFLTSGFHVRSDLPAQLLRSGRNDIRVTAALGPSRRLADAQALRLTDAGYRPRHAVVMAAAGSADPRACADVSAAARLLSVRIRRPVAIAYAASTTASTVPSVTEAVAALRDRPGVSGVAVSSYLLADGLFQQRLVDSGADVVAEPIGVAAEVVELACARISATRRLPVGSRA